MQNKPNFQKSQMNVNPYNTTDYENKSNWTIGESKPNSNPIKPNLQDTQMSINSILTRDYEGNDIFAVPESKPNSNPNKPNFRILSRQILSGQAFIRSGQVFVAQIHRTDTVRLISRNADSDRIGGGQFQPNDQSIGTIRVNYHALANVTGRGTGQLHGCRGRTAIPVLNHKGRIAKGRVR